MPQVIKLDTSNTGPTHQIITRIHQASISHHSSHKAQQPRNKSQSRYIVLSVCPYSFMILYLRIHCHKFFHWIETLFDNKKLDKIFLNFFIGSLFLISLHILLKLSAMLLLKRCSNNLVLWPIVNKSNLFLLLRE